MLYANDGAAPRRTIESGTHGQSDAIWVDLVDPTDAERATAERITGLRVPSREDLTEIENSSRVYTEDGVLFLSMPYSNLVEDHRTQITPVGFVLSRSRLLTLRYERLPAFDTYAEHFDHKAAQSSAEALIGLLEAIVDRQADLLERAAAELTRLSHETFQNEDVSNRRSIRQADRELRMTLTAIGRCGDMLGNLRDSVVGMARIVGFAQQSCVEWTHAELHTRMQTLRQDIASLNDYDQQLTNKVSFLLDAVLGFINIEQNNVVKVLTVFSIVGIPPTFVVGLYGMNFKNMPEYDWAYGYQYGWVMIFVSILVPVVWFRIKGWI